MRIILLIILIGINSCRDGGKEKEPTPVQEQKTISGLKLTDLDGQPISLEQFKGRTIFINFWATWCKPCVREIPSIKGAQELLTKENIVFLLASDETPEQIKEFKEDHFPELSYVRLMNMEELGLQGLPTTYVFNPKGELAFSETGYRKWDDSSNVQMLLKISNQK